MNIEFVSSEISGFYAYMLSRGKLSALRLSENDDAFFNCVKKLQQDICAGNIKNIDELNAFIKSNLPDRPDKVEQFKRDSIKDMQQYSSFYQQHTESVALYKKAVESVQIDPTKGYTEDLSKLYNFFDISKDFKCYGILAPVPQKEIDGCALGKGFIAFYDVEKKDDVKYVGNSLLPEKKISTPLHEATHILFGQSKIKQDLRNNQGKGAGRLLTVCDRYFKDHPDPQVRPVMLAIDEALAACSSRVLNERYQSTKNCDVFYYGFEGANALAKSFYPIYLEYMQQGKKIDDNFLMQAAEKFEISQKIECLREKLPNHSPVSEVKNLDEMRGVGIKTISGPVKPTTFDMTAIKQNKTQNGG